jgi:hypothetical protein
MVQRVEFEDVETALIAYLKAQLTALGDSASVGTKRLPSTPSRYVRVFRVGGVRNTLVTEQALVVFECWDATDVTASDLAKVTRGLVQALASTFVGPACLSWKSEVGGPAWNPHPDTSLPRYQHTQQIIQDGRTVGA